MVIAVENELVSVEAGLAYFPVRPSAQSVYRWIRGGQLRATRVGGRVYITREFVEEFLERGSDNGVESD